MPNLIESSVHVKHIAVSDKNIGNYFDINRTPVNTASHIQNTDRKLIAPGVARGSVG